MTCRVRVESRITGKVFDGVLSDERAESSFGQPVLTIDGEVQDSWAFKFLAAEVVRDA